MSRQTAFDWDSNLYQIEFLQIKSIIGDILCKSQYDIEWAFIFLREIDVLSSWNSSGCANKMEYFYA